MAVNLDIETYRNGDIIPQVTDPAIWAALKTGAWCFYNNDVAKGAKYGKLYNWYAVIDSGGLCPTGWHVSTNSDWSKLAYFLDPLSDTLDNANLVSRVVAADLKGTNGVIHVIDSVVLPK
jgi:uncharacterized protein (TIGR02145 family)